MGAIISGIMIGWTKWLADRVAALIISHATSPDKLEALCESIDAKVDLEEKLAPESGKATRQALIDFSDKLKENLTEPD